MRYVSGRVAEHDDEVNEARWVLIEEAAGMLAFKTERKVLGQARAMLSAAAPGTERPAP
jgi:NADH pyrophosphatase NudC (nudix superfamily)